MLTFRALALRRSECFQNTLGVQALTLLSCFILDIDECQARGVCINGQCINYPGGYECSCGTGFETSSDMHRCNGE